MPSKKKENKAVKLICGVAKTIHDKAVAALKTITKSKATIRRAIVEVGHALYENREVNRSEDGSLNKTQMKEYRKKLSPEYEKAFGRALFHVEVKKDNMCSVLVSNLIKIYEHDDVMKHIKQTSPERILKTFRLEMQDKAVKGEKYSKEQKLAMSDKMVKDYDKVLKMDENERAWPKKGAVTAKDKNRDSSVYAQFSDLKLSDACAVFERMASYILTKNEKMSQSDSQSVLSAVDALYDAIDGTWNDKGFEFDSEKGTFIKTNKKVA